MYTNYKVWSIEWILSGISRTWNLVVPKKDPEINGACNFSRLYCRCSCLITLLLKFPLDLNPVWNGSLRTRDSTHNVDKQKIFNFRFWFVSLKNWPPDNEKVLNFNSRSIIFINPSHIRIWDSHMLVGCACFVHPCEIHPTLSIFAKINITVIYVYNDLYCFEPIQIKILKWNQFSFILH